MKKLLLSAIILIVLSTLLYLIVLVIVDMEYRCSMKSYTADANPFDSDNKYIILENSAWGDHMPPSMFFTFVPVSRLAEHMENPEQIESMSGRKVGTKTTIDIAKYLGEEVYLEGEFYYGHPIIITKGNEIISWLKSKQLVLKIKSVHISKRDM